MILAHILFLFAPPAVFPAGEPLCFPSSSEGSAQGPEVAQEPFERRARCMGTELRVRIYGASRQEALSSSEGALLALERCERRLSLWDAESEVSRFHVAPIGEPVMLSFELSEELRSAVEVAESSGGAFHPGMGALIEAWDLRGVGRIPSAPEIAAAMSTSRLSDLVQTDRGWLRRDALTLATGGFGKGAGLRAASASLVQSKVQRAEIDLGGQWLLHGTSADRFDVDVAHPDNRKQSFLTLRVPPGSVATSGNSERSLQVQGRAIGHILDPRTGQPAQNFGSVTVWCEDPLQADAWATALFVLGPEAGIALAKKRKGIEALFLMNKGSQISVFATPTWEAQWRATQTPVLQEPSDRPKSLFPPSHSPISS